MNNKKGDLDAHKSRETEINNAKKKAQGDEEAYRPKRDSGDADSIAKRNKLQDTDLPNAKKTRGDLEAQRKKMGFVFVGADVSS